MILPTDKAAWQAEIDSLNRQLSHNGDVMANATRKIDALKAQLAEVRERSAINLEAAAHERIFRERAEAALEIAVEALEKIMDGRAYGPWVTAEEALAKIEATKTEGEP